jgi:L-seryl-tRNA(Ser) seleniumtransferase
MPPLIANDKEASFTMSYASLGVKAVVNAAGALSRLGGSVLSPGVSEAMKEASENFIDLPLFHDRAGEELARITNNEGACVSNGAAAGILVSVAACLAGDDIELAAKLPNATGLEKVNVLVWRKHVDGFLAGADQVLHNGYLSAVTMAGGTLRIIDEVDELKTSDAAMLWFPNVYPQVENEEDFLDLFLNRTRLLGIPFIVDAADQIPPISNLWYFTRDKGADLAIFSGGKGLKGPGSSGLIVGKKELIRACRVNSGPEHTIGRPAKVGKEEIAGLLKAVEEILSSDPLSETSRWHFVVDRWLVELDGLKALGFELRKTFTSHSGQPIPRAILFLPFADNALRDQIIDYLWKQNPSIAVLPQEGIGIALNPHMIKDDEVSLVSKAIVSAIAAVVQK